MTSKSVYIEYFFLLCFSNSWLKASSNWLKGKIFPKANRIKHPKFNLHPLFWFSNVLCFSFFFCRWGGLTTMPWRQGGGSQELERTNTDCFSSWFYISVFLGRTELENKEKQRKTEKQRSKQADKQTSKQANKQTNKQTSKQANKQTNKQWHNSLFILQLLSIISTMVFESREDQKTVDIYHVISGGTCWLQENV